MAINHTFPYGVCDTCDGWRAVHVDMYGVTSLPEVCARIASSYSRLSDNKLRAHLDALGARLGLSLTAAGPGITLGPLPVDEALAELSERFEELGEDPVGALSSLLSTAAGHP